MKKKSCVYIQGAIYLAPNEIRACCQRFHFKGQLKGDVPLVKVDYPRDVSFDEVTVAKKALLEGINNGTNDSCRGCPLLKTSDWKDLEAENVNIISIEDHSLCNMKCSYCSDTYYGGLPPKYDVVKLLDGISGVDSGLHIAWGGGEPTVRKDFEEIFGRLTSSLRPRTQRVFTNALKYSPALQVAIDSRKTSITTSVDAGTQCVFKKVRGSGRIDKVLLNLKEYSKKQPDLVTIKYIFTDENCSFGEIHGFVSNIEIYGLNKCNFLISTDFKAELISTEKLAGIVALYSLLYSKKIYAVTFDDHIFNKLRQVGQQIKGLLGGFDQDAEISASVKFLIESISARESTEVIVWGTGEFAKHLLTGSTKISKGEIRVSRIVDGNPGKWGTDFLGYNVESPEKLLTSNTRIVIASSNFYGEIVNSLKAIGVAPTRILPTFIL